MIQRNPSGRIVGRYEELIPEEAEQALAESTIVYLPMGSVEWHNTHLPFNTDTVIADGLCWRLAEKGGGLVFPANPFASACTWSKCGPYQFAPALGTVALYDGDLHCKLLQTVARRLIENGFKRIVILAGHVGKQDRDSMEQVASEINAGAAAKGLFIYPYLFTKGDHAGHWETLMLLGLRPDLVRRGRTYIPYEAGHPLTGTESSEEGRQKIEALVEAMWVKVRETFDLV